MTRNRARLTASPAYAGRSPCEVVAASGWAG